MALISKVGYNKSKVTFMKFLHKINKEKLFAKLDFKTVKIGILANEELKNKIGLNSNNCVVPDCKFGKWCLENCVGTKKIDRTSPKIKRYVCTITILPYNDPKNQPIDVDIYRKCYPIIETPPLLIELLLVQGKGNKEFIIANLKNKIITTSLIKHIVNMFIEIFGEVEIFEGQLKSFDAVTYERKNWIFLPPGEWPKNGIGKVCLSKKKINSSFAIKREAYIKNKGPKSVATGCNGFQGYFAYIFDKYVILECYLYGNATYIFPIGRWEELSKKTKYDLFVNETTVSKVVHREEWESKIEIELNKYF